MTKTEAPTDASHPSTGKGQLVNRLIRRACVLLVVAIVGLYMMSFSGRVPTDIGFIDGKLKECPASPNCVSTQTAQTDKRMPPIPYLGDRSSSLEQLKSVIEKNFPRAKLVCEKEHYLHYEFVSLIFRFVDDVEFVANDSSDQIEFRSASRVGHSDLGVNRKRMEKISREMKQ